MTSYQQVIDVLNTAKTDVAELLSETNDQHHALRIGTALQQQIDRFALLTGTAASTTKAEEPRTLGPATSIAGEKLTGPKKVQADDLKPRDEKVELLKAQVEETYKSFLTTDNKDLLKVDHLVLRGVAKKAGLPVTKDEPKKLDVPFIKEVKAAIEKENAVLDTKIADAKGKLEAAQAVANQLEQEKAPEEQLLKAADDVAEAFKVLETLQKQRG